MILIDIEQKSEQFVAVCAKSKQIEHQFLHQNQFLQRTWILQSFGFFSARETFHLQNFHLDSHFLCHLFARKIIFTTFKWTLNTCLQKYNYESFDLASKVPGTVKNCLLHQHCTFLSLPFVWHWYNYRTLLALRSSFCISFVSSFGLSWKNNPLWTSCL